MERLSDELLIESYLKASELNLSPDFLALIEEEVQKREITYHINILKEAIK